MSESPASCVDEASVTFSSWPIRPRYRMVFIGLGSLLIPAGLLKAHQLATIPSSPDAWLSPMQMAILVQAELLLGVFLLCNVSPRLLWWISLAAFGGFTVVTLSRVLSSEESCGCFGTIDVSPWWTMLIDIVAVSLLIKCRPPRSVRNSLTRAGLSLSLYLFIALPVAFSIGRFELQQLRAGMQQIENENVVLLEPESWLNQPFPLISFIEDGARLARGKWRVLLFHHDCPRCQEVLPDYVRQAANGARIALVEVPPFGDTEGTCGRCWESRLSPSYEWFVTTPVEIQINAGTVRKVVAEMHAGD